MMKLIRWQGLAAFVGIWLVVALVWIFLVDGIVRSKIEQYGSSAVGAVVELEKADVSLFPLGLELVSMKVANPDDPMTNAVEFERAVMAIDSGKLFMRKIIVDDMSLVGVKFNTPRETSGALPEGFGKKAKKKENKKEKKDGLSLPSFEIPDARTILENEDLETMKVIGDLEKDIKNARDNWDKELLSLPDEQKLKEYEKRVKDLKKSSRGGLGGLLGGASELSALQKDLEKDLASLENAGKGFDRKLADFSKRIAAAKNAPENDFMRLKEKYGFSTQGAGNITRLLFGSAAGDYLEKAIYWYEKIEPYLEKESGKGAESEIVRKRGKGEDIHFSEREPLPDFLIRNIQAEVRLEAGDLAGTIENVTTDQEKLGLPITFSFSGDTLKNLHSAKFSGTLDHRDSARSKDTVFFGLKEYRLEKITLSDSKDMPVSIENASSDMTGEAKLENDGIEVQFAAMMKSVTFGGMREGSDTVSDILISALSEISEFTVEARAQGTLKDYDVSLSSDLDNSMKNALSKAMKKQSARFEGELRKGILSKVESPMNGLQGEYGGFEAIGDELAKRLETGSDLKSLFKVF